MVAVGKIVEVQGGHILRGTGRKDRHSKVYTSKGPRDRRVRLSAGTAIQFYDVQDRLGYDRPSEAVDWLIMKAKASIDALNEQPAGMPSGASIGTGASSQQGRKCHENHAPESSSLKEFVGYGLQHGSSGYEAVLQDFHHVTEDSAYVSSYLAADEFNLLSDELSNKQLGNETEDMRICTEALQASVLRQDQWSGWSDQLLKGKGQFPDTMSLNSKLNTRNEDDNSDFSSWPLSLQLSVLGQYHSYSRETALQFGGSSLIDSVISPEISDSDLCQRALLGTGFSYSNVAMKHYDSMQIPGFEANHNSVFQSSNPAP